MKTAFRFALIYIFAIFLLSTTFAQLDVKDGDDNILLQVNDYGTTGTVTLLPFGPILPTFPLNNYMLYNIDGTLYWNGSALGTSNNAGGWTHSGTKIYNTVLTDNVGIGTNNPQSKLSVGGLGNSAAIVSSETTSGWGVYGKATIGRGVFGSANGTGGEGVIAEAHGQNGRAISGYASDASGYAGYFGGNVQINGSTKLGINGTSFLEIREITGTTNASGSSVIVTEGLPDGWTGAKTRLLSLEIKQSANNIWMGQGGNSGGDTSIWAFFYDDSRKIVIHYPEFHAFWNQTWRAVIMRMP